MVAQGATVAVLIASAGLSQIRFKDDEEEEGHHEKQWQDIVSLGNTASPSHLYEYSLSATCQLYQINQPQEQTPPMGRVHPSHAGRS